MSISVRTRFRILDRDDFTCQYCGRRAPEVVLHVDHIVPRARGGRDHDGNLRTACEGCNLGKSDRPLVNGAADYLANYDDEGQGATCDPNFWPEIVL